MPNTRSSGLRAMAAWTGALALAMALQASAAQAGATSAGATSASASGPGGLAGDARLADFKGEAASPETRRIAHWALHSGDHAGMPYMIVDKVQARVFVFDKEGRLQGAGPALLGMERGDGTALGLGERKLAAIAPQERTTPAGRFVASLARDMKGQEILWIDYDSALALHRVVKGTPTERRAERLQSASAEDNRISYGCINVPVAFYEGVVSPAFAHSSGVVYILPETRPAQEVFGSYEVDTGGKSPDSSQH
ncbi:L,D-transpeptidase [Pseudoxanthomonas gei]|nr:L,D-transpeptidase [Pseudoxanthomonas gei]